MPKGGYRAGAGRPRGVKDSKPRKGTPAHAEAEQVRQLLALGIKAKKKFYQEFIIRVANKDGNQKPLSLAEKKMMNEIAIEMAAEDGGQTETEISEGMTPLDYMLRVMNDPKEPKDRRDRLAIAAAPFVHPRKGEAGTGKKDEQSERAKSAGQGKFKAGRAPLALVK